MLISYVLRLRPDALANGRFAGEIELVSTRERRSVRALDQVATFIAETASSQVEELVSAQGGHPAWCAGMPACDDPVGPPFELASEPLS
jgi:hypothetical protein